MSTPVAMIADHIWQSTFVVAVVWMLSRLLRANSAAVRHWLWLAASMKFLVPFWLLTQAGSLIEWPSVAVVGDWSRSGQLLSAPFSAEVLSVSGAPATASAGSGGLVLLFAAWATGAVLILGHWWYRWWQLRRIVARATPVEMGAPIEARISDGHGPGVFGVVRPVPARAARAPRAGDAGRARRDRRARNVSRSPPRQSRDVSAHDCRGAVLVSPAGLVDGAAARRRAGTRVR